MADTGFKFGIDAIGTRGAGDVAWATVSNVLSDNDEDAFVTFTNLQDSQGLAIKDFDFSSIPVGATIDGVEVRVSQYGSTFNFDIDWQEIRLIVGDVDGTENKASALPAPGDPDQNEIIGGPTDTWSETLTRGNVQDGTDFGVFFTAVDLGGGATIFIQFVEMKIFYTVAAGPTPPKYTRRHIGFLNG